MEVSFSDAGVRMDDDVVLVKRLFFCSAFAVVRSFSCVNLTAFRFVVRANRIF